MGAISWAGRWCNGTGRNHSARTDERGTDGRGEHDRGSASLSTGAAVHTRGSACDGLHPTDATPEFMRLLSLRAARDRGAQQCGIVREQDAQIVVQEARLRPLPHDSSFLAETE